VGYTVGLVGAVLTIVQFVLWVSDASPPSGLTLVLLLLIPFLVLLCSVALLAGLFRRQITDEIRAHADDLNDLAEVHMVQLTEASTQFSQQAQVFVDEQSKLVDQLMSLTTHQRLAEEISDYSHHLNAEVASHPDSIDEKFLRRSLKRACRDMATAFKHNGIECRVCVKQVAETTDHKLIARTICRDSGTAADAVEHYIQQNTDFAELLSGTRDYWYCEDVRSYPGYSNTSPAYTYHSVIVWPIIAGDLRQIRDDPDFAAPTDVDDPVAPIVGFLCLDSENIAEFSEQAHVPLGWMVSDSMARVYEKLFQGFLTDDQ
jgi:hypothetical protein